MRQPRQGLAPPGRVPEPSDERGERQDRRPGLERRPLGAPDRVGAEGPPQEPASDPDEEGDRQEDPRQALRETRREQVDLRRAGQDSPQAMDFQGGDAQGDEHRGRRDEAVDPVGPAPSAGERPRQVTDDEPGQERAEDHHGRHLLEERQAQEHADRHAPGAGVGLVQPLPERQGRGRPEEEPGHVGRRDVAVAVDAGHEQERARHHPADPGAVPPRQEPEPDRDRQRVLEDRRQPTRRDVLHPAAEEGVRQEVRTGRPGEGGSSSRSDRRASNRAGCSARAAPTRRPGSAPGRAAPTIERTSAGCSGTPARPRSGRSRRSSAPWPPAPRPARSQQASHHRRPVRRPSTGGSSPPRIVKADDGIRPASTRPEHTDGVFEGLGGRISPSSPGTGRCGRGLDGEPPATRAERLEGPAGPDV